jgi:hypothetical protein
MVSRFFADATTDIFDVMGNPLRDADIKTESGSVWCTPLEFGAVALTAIVEVYPVGRCSMKMGVRLRC